MLTEEQFTRAVKQNMDTVYRVAVNYLRDPAAAEDVCQEVFLRLFRSSPEFESEEHCRNWLIRALNDIPRIRCAMPKGAFYAFPDISAFGLSSKEFCDRLLEEAGVATSWGTSFGEAGEGFIRLSYATSLENLKVAAERIYEFTKSL